MKKDFYCLNTSLESLEGCPKEVGEDFICGDNKVHFTVEDIRKMCNVKGKIRV